MYATVCVLDLQFDYSLFYVVQQDAMTALNSELQLSQGAIGELKSSIGEVGG